jgi:hypothetical protein
MDATVPMRGDVDVSQVFLFYLSIFALEKKSKTSSLSDEPESPQKLSSVKGSLKSATSKLRSISLRFSPVCSRFDILLCSPISQRKADMEAKKKEEQEQEKVVMRRSNSETSGLVVNSF